MTQALMRILALFFALLSTTVFAGENRDYPLGPGDVLRVQVFQNPDLTTETRVSESGVITYPLIGNIEVGGLPITDAEKKDCCRAKEWRFRSPATGQHRCSANAWKSGERTRPSQPSGTVSA